MFEGYGQLILQLQPTNFKFKLQHVGHLLSTQVVENLLKIYGSVNSCKTCDPVLFL